jgi:hypothetical protein
MDRTTKHYSPGGGTRNGSSSSRIIVVMLLFLPLIVFVSVLIVSLILFPNGTRNKISRLFYGPPPRLPYTPLDFIVAGFPKCGTTTLLMTLSQHAEIAMPQRESCQLARPLQQDDINLQQLQSDLYELKQQHEHKSSASVKVQQQQHKLLLGIKCPDALKNFKTIHRLALYAPQTKFIIGLRHPLLYLESLYNYRVLEVHQGKKSAAANSLAFIPSASSSSSNSNRSSSSSSSSSSTRSSNNNRARTNRGEVIPTLWDIYHASTRQSSSWYDVSHLAPQFEVYLAQFGKTHLSVAELQTWFRPPLSTTTTLPSTSGTTTATTATTATIATMENVQSDLYGMLAVKPNHFQIFLYTLNQLQNDATRATSSTSTTASSSSSTTTTTTTSFSSATFRRDLQTFLNLKHPIAPFGHENINHEASSSSSAGAAGDATKTKNDRISNRNITATTRAASLATTRITSARSLLGLDGDNGEHKMEPPNKGNDIGSNSIQQQLSRPPRLPGMIDICSFEYNDLRRQVLDHYAKVTLPWLAHQFLASPDVVTSQPEFIWQTLHEWTADPCTTRTSSSGGGDGGSGSSSNRQRPKMNR